VLIAKVIIQLVIEDVHFIEISKIKHKNKISTNNKYYPNSIPKLNILNMHTNKNNTSKHYTYAMHVTIILMIIIINYQLTPIKMKKIL